MGFDRWNKALVASLCIPMPQICESHALINQAHLTVLELDGRFSEQAKPLHKVLYEQYAALTLKEGLNASVDQVHPNAQAIAASGRRWLDKNVDDTMRCDILTQRVALDPLDQQGMPLTLRIRLFDSGISPLYYVQVIQQTAFNEGAGPSLNKPWRLPIAEAIVVVQNTLTPMSQKRLHGLIHQGRLRLTSGLGIGNVCVISSAGAFIALEAEQGVVDVLALSHEVGHALAVEQQWHQGNYWPDEVVKSEAAAIATECHVLDKSLYPKHYCDDRKQALHQFYGPWHLALHRFELGLYGMANISPKTLDHLWQECTHMFGAETDGWKYIQHYYTSPFYLICYPLALEKVFDR